MKQLSVILLAGGIGSRMNSPIPKQFLMLQGKRIVNYSYDFFKNLGNIHEIIVVCDPSFRSYFEENEHVKLKFALPGTRRQDSVFNGLSQVSENSDFVMIHDGARPFLNKKIVEMGINEAILHGAATLATPLKFTVKQAGPNGLIKKTLDRSTLFEIQTPQIIKTEKLKQGFKVSHETNIEVTDDVSLIELLGLPVKLVMSSYQNIKITTRDDLSLAEKILETYLP